MTRHCEHTAGIVCSLQKNSRLERDVGHFNGTRGHSDLDLREQEVLHNQEEDDSDGVRDFRCVLFGLVATLDKQHPLPPRQKLISRLGEDLEECFSGSPTHKYLCESFRILAARPE